MKNWLLVLTLILCFSTVAPTAAIAVEETDPDVGDILPPQHSVD